MQSSSGVPLNVLCTDFDKVRGIVIVSSVKVDGDCFE